MPWLNSLIKEYQGNANTNYVKLWKQKRKQCSGKSVLISFPPRTAPDRRTGSVGTFRDDHQVSVLTSLHEREARKSKNKWERGIQSHKSIQISNVHYEMLVGVSRRPRKQRRSLKKQSKLPSTERSRGRTDADHRNGKAIRNAPCHSYTRTMDIY